MKTLEEFIKKHKPLIVSYEYNQHKRANETIERYIEYNDKDDFIDEEDYEECLKTNTVHSLIVYPDSRVGQYRVCASTLEKALEIIDYSIDN